jgi:inward rectifier potassium channel
MVTMPFPKFLLTVFLSYVTVNFLFGLLYFALGVDALHGTEDAHTMSDRFLRAMFFSSQTLTTVGYGVLSPKTLTANALAATEAFLGLLGFAVATGVLFGRVSHATARFGFSEKALIAPYQDGRAFQFRVVNRRRSALMELEATVLLMKVQRHNGGLRRDFQVMTLERRKVMFFPLTWTVVHPIDDSSPLAGMTAEDLEHHQAEFLILMKGWDDTLSQVVHQRFSYRWDELVWGGRFKPAFSVGEDGNLLLDVDQVGAYSVHQ